MDIKIVLTSDEFVPFEPAEMGAIQGRIGLLRPLRQGRIKYSTEQESGNPVRARASRGGQRYFFSSGFGLGGWSAGAPLVCASTTLPEPVS